MLTLELWKQLRADQCFLRPQKKKETRGNPGVRPGRPILCVWKTIWLCQPPKKKKEISVDNLNRGGLRDSSKGTRRGPEAACGIGYPLVPYKCPVGPGSTRYRGRMYSPVWKP